MNAVQMRIHYETECKRCVHLLRNSGNIPKNAESMCTAPQGEKGVMWILRITGESFSSMTWYDNILKECTFKEKEVK